MHAVAAPMDVPPVAFGTYKMKKQKVQQPLRWALESGVSMVDTAFVYNNEAEVGQVLAETGSSALVVTKLWRSHYSHDAAAVEARLDEQIALLTRVDIWLIHFPGPGMSPGDVPKPKDWTPAMRADTWRAMLACVRKGKCRAVGVCNFSVRQMQQLYDASGEWPCLNQLEIHPLCQRRDIVRFCQERDIVVMAYGVFGSREKDLLGNATIVRIANAVGCSPGRVLLSWACHKRLLAGFGSENEQHIRENALPGSVVDLSTEHLAAIDALEEENQTMVFGWRGLIDLDSADEVKSAAEYAYVEDYPVIFSNK